MKVLSIGSLVVHINNLWILYRLIPKFVLLSFEKEFRGFTLTILNFEIIVVW